MAVATSLSKISEHVKGYGLVAAFRPCTLTIFDCRMCESILISPSAPQRGTFRYFRAYDSRVYTEL